MRIAMTLSATPGVQRQGDVQVPQLCSFTRGSLRHGPAERTWSRPRLGRAVPPFFPAKTRRVRALLVVPVEVTAPRTACGGPQPRPGASPTNGPPANAPATAAETDQWRGTCGEPLVRLKSRPCPSG